MDLEVCADLMGLTPEECRRPARFRAAFMAQCLEHHPLSHPEGSRAKAARKFRDAREAFFELNQLHAQSKKTGKCSKIVEGENSWFPPSMSVRLAGFGPLPLALALKSAAAQGRLRLL